MPARNGLQSRKSYQAHRGHWPSCCDRGATGPRGTASARRVQARLQLTGTVSNKFTILTSTSGVPFPSGTFKDPAEGAIISTATGQSFRITYLGGPVGKDVLLTLPTPPQIGGIQKVPDGGMVVTGSGIPGMYYTLVATTNLANPVWEELFTVIAEAATGAISITDSYASSEHPVRFYKIQAE